MARQTASTADLAPQPQRPGTEAWDALPSRIGDHLHYRDGRVTRMDGALVQAAPSPTDYRPTHDGSTRPRMVFGSD